MAEVRPCPGVYPGIHCVGCPGCAPVGRAKLRKLADSLIAEIDALLAEIGER